MYIKPWLLCISKIRYMTSDSSHLYPCISMIKFVALLTTLSIPWSHHCNLGNQPTNTPPYQALPWINLYHKSWPWLINLPTHLTRQFGFNISALSHDRQTIKHPTGVNFNPEKKHMSNSINDTTHLASLIHSRSFSSAN